MAAAFDWTVLASYPCTHDDGNGGCDEHDLDNCSPRQGGSGPATNGDALSRCPYIRRKKRDEQQGQTKSRDPGKPHHYNGIRLPQGCHRTKQRLKPRYS